MITVFTPTYNRCNLLKKLYNSLSMQSDKDFEWLIVDDGSIDNTELIVKECIRCSDFPIRYFGRENGGKHRAINMGVELAKGELFFIVDSDDTLTPNAIERIKYYYSSIKDNDNFAGVCGLRKYSDGCINGFRKKFDVLDSNSNGISQYLSGDKAEAYKTSILKRYPFPEFENEKFISEGIVWNRISKEFKIRYFFEPITIGEYLTDGLTKSIVKHHRNSPYGSLLYYKEKLESGLSTSLYIKTCINYYRYSFMVKKIPHSLRISWKTRPLAIFGFLLYLKDSLL